MVSCRLVRVSVRGIWLPNALGNQSLGPLFSLMPFHAFPFPFPPVGLIGTISSSIPLEGTARLRGSAVSPKSSAQGSLAGALVPPRGAGVGVGGAAAPGPLQGCLEAWAMNHEPLMID